MLCPKCGQDRHPTIELAQRPANNALGIGAFSGFVQVCGNGACHYEFGPAMSGQSTKATASTPFDSDAVSATSTPPARTIAPVATATSALPIPVSTTNHVDRMRVRLAELQPLAEEYELLQRALRAVDRPRKPRRSNVVPIGKASAQ